MLFMLPRQYVNEYAPLGAIFIPTYPPKSIPKNIRLISFRAPLATLASGLRTALV